MASTRSKRMQAAQTAQTLHAQTLLSCLQFSSPQAFVDADVA